MFCVEEFAGLSLVFRDCSNKLLSKWSTGMQLLSVLINIIKILDNRAQTDVIYFKLSKAFDSVPHEPLLHRLKNVLNSLAGVHCTPHAWFLSISYQRYQRVVIDVVSLEWLPVLSGMQFNCSTTNSWTSRRT